MRRYLVLGAALAASSVSAQDAPLPNQAVPVLDLQRYSGQWHEIAHLPMFFQRKCVDNITATYAIKPDGNIRVNNACDQKGGERTVSEGTARPVQGHQAGPLKRPKRTGPSEFWGQGCGLALQCRNSLLPLGVDSKFV